MRLFFSPVPHALSSRFPLVLFPSLFSRCNIFACSDLPLPCIISVPVACFALHGPAASPAGLMLLFIYARDGEGEGERRQGKEEVGVQAPRKKVCVRR